MKLRLGPVVIGRRRAQLLGMWGIYWVLTWIVFPWIFGSSSLPFNVFVTFVSGAYAVWTGFFRGGWWDSEE